MPDEVHKYYCPSCNRNLYGESLKILANALNRHNELAHPADCCTWTEQGIAHSGFYTGPGFVTRSATPEEKRVAAGTASGPLREYTEPYGTTSRGEWGGAKAPVLTEDDKIMLAKGLVKW